MVLRLMDWYIILKSTLALSCFINKMVAVITFKCHFKKHGIAQFLSSSFAFLAKQVSYGFCNKWAGANR